MSTDSYHITNFGSLASRDLRPDMDGYVHLTIEAVIGGRWDAMTQMDVVLAADIAQANRRATDDSNRNVDDWNDWS